MADRRAAMSLRRPDHWIWDSWFAIDGPDFHCFYLQAPRSLGDERLRHRAVSIGHAVSRDLRNWEILPDALHPDHAAQGSWDDFTTWTGSIVRHEGLWFLFYTGGNRAEDALVQRIGLATSRDLIHWERHPANPVIVSDPTWYEQLDLNLWHDQAWRDPWVMRCTEHDAFHALITSRVNQGPADGRGVIALATSPDLIEWTVHGPITEPGEFGHMEVPQVFEFHGRSYLLFSTSAEVHSARRRRRSANQLLTGTYYLVADDPHGPFHSRTEKLLLGDLQGTHYGGKILRVGGDEWVLMAMRHYNANGHFVGELADPLRITIDKAGQIDISPRG